MNFKKLMEDAPAKLGESVFYLREHGPKVLRAMRVGAHVGQVIERAGGLASFVKNQVAEFALDVLEGNVEIEVKRVPPGQRKTDSRGQWRRPSP